MPLLRRTNTSRSWEGTGFRYGKWGLHICTGGNNRGGAQSKHAARKNHIRLGLEPRPPYEWKRRAGVLCSQKTATWPPTAGPPAPFQEQGAQGKRKKEEGRGQNHPDGAQLSRGDNQPGDKITPRERATEQKRPGCTTGSRQSSCRVSCMTRVSRVNRAKTRYALG